MTSTQEQPSLKARAASGLVWGGFSNGMIQLLGAVFGLILLNLLVPSDYGKMAALMIFSNVAGCLQESGFTAALANKKEARQEDYNAVFWFNVIVGTLLYIILFLAAPAIADFYHEPVLKPLARFVFIGLWISCLGISQQAWLFSHLQVKQTSLINLTALVVSNIVGIIMVFSGFAFWGLATQSVLYTAVGTGLRWWVSPWRPSLPAKQEEIDNGKLTMENAAKPSTNCPLSIVHYPLSIIHSTLSPAWRMFGFSSKLLINSLAYQLNNNAFGVLLNRFYPGGHVAGIFSNARKWDDMAIATIGGMVQGVAQPVLVESESAAFRKLLRFTCFISFPCLLGLALIAEDFIVLLVGEKWHESARMLSLLCVYGAFSPVVTLYSNLVISRGRSTINMTIGLLNCALVWGGIIVLHAMGQELTAMVIYYVVLNVAWLLVWQASAKHLVGLRWRDALRDVAPFFVFALGVMLLCWWATSSMPISWWRLFARISMAVVLYVGLLWITRAKILRESLQYIFHHGQL